VNGQNVQSTLRSVLQKGIKKAPLVNGALGKNVAAGRNWLGYKLDLI
jgi:hypothetical protein